MSPPRVSNVLKEIEEAFEGVTRGEGISLHDADAIDDHGGEVARAEARARDETGDWRKIADEVIGASPDVLCFMDLAGLRFHLPAYMHFALRRFADSDSRSLDAAIFRLTDSEGIETLRPVLTPRQIGAVLAFLAACADSETFESHRHRIGLAIRQWQGEEAARRELKSIEESVRRSMDDIFALSSEVGFDWFTKYVNGELNERQALRASHALDAIGECGPEG